VRKQIQALGKRMIEEGMTDPKVIATDKSMFEARGPKWHKKHRQRGIIPKKLRDVDVDSEWGYSRYRGWVQGYALVLVNTATEGTLRVPTDAQSATANCCEKHLFYPMIEELPQQTRYIVADLGFDDKKLFDTCERVEHGREKRRLVLPLKQCKSTSTKRSSHVRFFNSAMGQRIYKLRKTSVEPLFDILKSLFDMEPVWMKGEQNVSSLLLLTVYAYQILLYFNQSFGDRTAHVKYILDGV
jgi:hypothetical protein